MPRAKASHRSVWVLLFVMSAGCQAAASAPPSVPLASQNASVSESPSAEAIPSATVSTIAPPACPVPFRGGTCLGVLPAGTYGTTTFTPTFAYTVPDGGWANWEDRTWMFLLLAPGESLAGTEPDTSEFVGVFRGVRAAAAGCDEVDAPGVGHSAQALVDWYASQPGLVVTEPQPTSVGGLSGLMIDLDLAPGWTEMCPFIPDVPMVPLLFGSRYSSSLGLVVQAGITTRLYLLDFDDDNIAVYVADHVGRFSLDEYDAIIQTIQFDLGS